MTADEAVAALDALTWADPEAAHREADRVILLVVPHDVRAAYERVQARVGGWWYS